MIKFQKISKVVILLIAVTGLFACSDDDSVAPFSVTGDVFTNKRMIDDEVQYAASYYAYGTQAMGVAKVSIPNNVEEIVLAPLDGFNNTWYDIPELSDFSMATPLQGNYLFRVTHEDVPHEASDLLTVVDLDFSEITTLEMESGILTVAWTADAARHGHSITLLDAAGEIVFTSSYVPKQGNQLQIGANTGTGNWAAGYPNPGDVYSLELNAFALESDAENQENPGLHIEELAISEATVNWE